jgi:hypothetical protein
VWLNGLGSWITKQLDFQQYFSYIMATSFSGGGSRNTRKEPPTMGKQLVSFILSFCIFKSFYDKVDQ